jgi:hypothetical protein
VRPADENEWVDSAIADHRGFSDFYLARTALDQGFDDVLAGILAAEPQGTVVSLARRRISHKAAALSVALVVVASAGAAAAVQGGALTGLFASGGDGDTEIVNFAAPNFPEVAHDFARQIEGDGLRFAPGYSAEKSIDAVIKNDQDMVTSLGSGETAEQQIKGEFAYYAACTWQQSWLAASAARDASEMSRDVQGMIAITHVIVSSPGKNGTTVTEAALSGINQTRTQHQLIRYMEHGEVAQLTVDTVNGCPNATE